MNSLHHSTIDFCQRGKQWGMCTTLGAHVVLAALLLAGWPNVATQVLPAPAVAQEQAVLSLRVTPAPQKTPTAPPEAAPPTLPTVPTQPPSPMPPARPKMQEQVRPAPVNPAAPAKPSPQARTAKATSTKASNKKGATQASPAPAVAPAVPQAHSQPRASAQSAAQTDNTQVQHTAQAQQTVLRYFMALLEQYKHYPRAARKLGLEGRITVELRLDAQGNIAHLAIGAADAHPVLQKALGESLHKIRSHWQPQQLTQAGEPAGGQALSLTVPVRFSLQDAQ